MTLGVQQVQRRYPRFSVNRPVTAVTFWDDMPVAKIHGRAVVIGEGGMAATVTADLYVGDVVRLHLPPAPALYAKVCHAHGGQYGFEFLYSSGDQRDAIRKLCDTGALRN